MPIKYDDIDLLEIFVSEPQSLNDNIQYYTVNKDDLSLTLWIYINERKCTLFLETKGKNLVSVRLHKVTEIKKHKNNLIFKSDEEEIANVHIGETISISVY